MHDIALSVLTEVIAYYPHRQEILIDAGALALSKDRGADHLHQKGNQKGEKPNFGHICDLNYQEYSQLTLVGLSQEHGKIKTHPDFNFNTIQIGTQLRILPNHSCLVTALYDQLYVVQGDQIVDQWSPVRGW
jgi:D-serine deaminase-like pyridoxal phosphate-dependent protein